MRSIREKYDRHFLWWELVAAFVVTGSLVLLIEAVLGRDELNEVLDGNRQNLYVAVASVAGSLLGFSVTTVSIILAFTDSPRLRVLRESRHYGTIFVIFFSAIKFLAMTTVVAFVGLLFDREMDTAVVVTYVVLFSVIVSALRLWRCVWILEKVIGIAVAGQSRETPRNP